MKTKNVGIIHTRIRSIANSIIWNKGLGFYCTNINFENNIPLFSNTFRIKCEKYHKCAVEFQDRIIEQFHLADIHNGDEVAILFEENMAIAISKLGSSKWIDVNDFEIKRFSDLDITITDLTVY